MDFSTPGFAVLHHLPELAQTHVHWFGDAIQPSHPPLSPSPPAFNVSQLRVFSSESALCIRWPSSSRWWSFSSSISPSNEYSGIDFLWDWLVWSFCSPRDSQGSSPTPQFKSINSSVLSFLHIQLSHPYKNVHTTIQLHSSHTLAK